MEKMNAMNQAPAINEAAQKIKEGAVELKHAVVVQGTDSLDKACKETEATIKANPYRSVLVAFGVGALLGAVFFRR
jgi:ElaB/YqjD/DUF883 family membrane-anchored ribosome-binding protein